MAHQHPEASSQLTPENMSRLLQQGEAALGISAAGFLSGDGSGAADGTSASTGGGAVGDGAGCTGAASAVSRGGASPAEQQAGATGLSAYDRLQQPAVAGVTGAPGQPGHVGHFGTTRASRHGKLHSLAAERRKEEDEDVRSRQCRYGGHEYANREGKQLSER